MEVKDNQIVQIKGDPDHPANRGRLCTKGSTAAIPLQDPGRLSSAFLRRSRMSAPEPIGMDEAIAETAERLNQILREHGPDAVSFYVSGQMSLEAQYLINKLAKGFIRTSNIEANSRLCMASAASGYKLSLGADGPPGSYDDLDQADLFFVSGANMADCHPILFLRMMDRVKSGAKLIVVDPRRTATADKADLFLPIKPGSDLALLNGLLYLLLQNGAIDESFISDHTVGFEAMPGFLEDYHPQKVSEWTGIPEEDIRKAADWIGRSSNWMSLWTMGLNQSTHGTWHTNAICNLHLATGAICRPGSGPFSLTGQPNAMGGREMGYMGPGLPGQRSLLDEADREHAEQLWSLPRGSIRTEVQAGTVSMFERMTAGEIKACWIICTNPAATVPHRRKVLEGLQAAELVISQDAFFETETNRYADLMLPAALWAEGEGVMVNSERNVTLMQQAVEPPGDALPDWQIIARVACAMGFGEAFSYASAGDVYAEIQEAWNPATGYDLRGAGYSRLREGSMQWPCSPDDPQKRNPIRYLSLSPPAEKQPSLQFPTEHGRAVFWARPYLPPVEKTDKDYPFVLNTGRVQHQWHTLTKTGKVAKLNKLNPGPFVEIHQEDARQLHIQERDLVEIASRRGSAVLPAVITDRVQRGSCFAPIHWNDLFGSRLAINEVTIDAVDPISLQPELKYCAVSLVKAEVQPSPPDVPEPLHSPVLSSEGGYQEKMLVMADLLGFRPSQKIEWTENEQAYISGFLQGLGGQASSKPVPSLPPSADMNPVKRAWVNGLLAGLFTEEPAQAGTLTLDRPGSDPSSVTGQSGLRAAAAVTPPSAAGRSITLVWASQTGNAEEAANYCAGKLREKGMDVQLIGMDEITAAELKQKSLVLFAASTFGAGDPPDQGAAFFQALKADVAPRLDHLSYAVLALGDSSYDSFSEFGRNLDERLHELGAKRLLECACCDGGYQDTADQWLSRITPGLINAQGALQLEATPELGSSQPAASGRLQSPAGASVQSAAQSAAAAEAAEPAGYSRQKPFRARLLVNRLLNQPGSRKETRQYAFDLSGSGLTYEAGDALGIWPSNCPQLVQELLELLGLAGTDEIIVNRQPLTLRDALLHHYDIERVTPGMLDYIRTHSRGQQQFRPNDSLHDSLNDYDALNGSLHADSPNHWLRERQLIDLLQAFPAAVSPSEWALHLRPLQPRLYSISSSSRKYPDEVHITVSTVRYELAGRARKGVCSTFLADRLQSGGEVPLFIHKNAHFRPPASPSSDIIMIGPGTGIAPFRGFLQEREAIRATGRSWLFFGEQHAALDFYYQDELEAYRNNHLLHRLDTAFSRDQPEKVYVQHKMAEHGAELWSWLDGGAYVYVCGDAAEMAHSVDQTLLEIIRKHGGLTAEQANQYLQDLKRSKRYCKDVY